MLNSLEKRTTAYGSLSICCRNELFHIHGTLEQAATHQGGNARIDHDGRATHIGLVLPKVAIEMAGGDVVHEAYFTAPCIARLGGRQCRYIGKVGMLGGHVTEQCIV